MYAFWRQDEVLPSATRFTFRAAPPDVDLVLHGDCNACRALSEDMAELHDAGQIKLRSVIEPEAPKSCHRVRVFDEELRGLKGFRARFWAKPKTLLEHQKQFVTFYSPRSEAALEAGAALDPVLKYWCMGSGKTFSILTTLIGPQRKPVPLLVVVCPKSVMSDWGDELVNIRPLGDTVVWLMAPASFARVLAGEGREFGLSPSKCRDNALVLDESQTYRNETDARELDLAAIRASRELYLLSGTPIPKASDSDALFRLMRVQLKDSKGRHRSLEDVCDELSAKRQVSYYNPSLTNPAWFREHFPRVERKRSNVALSWTQLACCLKAEGKLVVNNQQFKDALRNAYHTRTRGLCNAVTMPSGLVLSPKIDQCVSLIEDMANKRFAVYSNYLDLGIHAVAKKLKAACVDFVMIDGAQSVEARERALSDYNSGKVRVILFSSAAGTGVNVMGTDVMVVLGVEFVESVQQQAEGRVARFHSHKPDSTVQILEFVSVLPSDPPEGEDLEALTELWMDLTRERDVKKARKDAQTLFVDAIRASLEEFKVDETTEEMILKGHARDAASSKPILDALALAGTWTADACRRQLRKRLGFSGEKAADGPDPADLQTFANFCRARKRPKVFRHVTGRDLEDYVDAK